jgi:hypothetical protein
MHRRIPAITLALAAMPFAARFASAQNSGAQTAEQVYKNITELKGTPADQLVPAMQFIASALGVECVFCHVQGKMDADDKPAKKTARQNDGYDCSDQQDQLRRAAANHLLLLPSRAFASGQRAGSVGVGCTHADGGVQRRAGRNCRDGGRDPGQVRGCLGRR